MALFTLLAIAVHAKDGVLPKQTVYPEKLQVTTQPVVFTGKNTRENNVNAPGLTLTKSFDCTQTYSGTLSCGQQVQITVSLYAIMPAADCQQELYQNAYWIYLAMDDYYCGTMCGPLQ